MSNVFLNDVMLLLLDTMKTSVYPEHGQINVNFGIQTAVVSSFHAWLQDVQRGRITQEEAHSSPFVRLVSRHWTHLAEPLRRGAQRGWLWRAPPQKPPHIAGWETPGPVEGNDTTSLCQYSSLLSSTNGPEVEEGTAQVLNAEEVWLTNM